LRKTDLERSGAKKVLLLQPEFLPFEEVVIRVKYSRDVFSQVPIQNSLDVISVIDWKC